MAQQGAVQANALIGTWGVVLFAKASISLICSDMEVLSSSA